MKVVYTKSLADFFDRKGIAYIVTEHSDGNNYMILDGELNGMDLFNLGYEYRGFIQTGEINS